MSAFLHKAQWNTDAAQSMLAMPTTVTPSGRLHVLAVYGFYCCSGPTLTRMVLASGLCSLGRSIWSRQGVMVLWGSQPHMLISIALVNPIPVSSHQFGCYSLVHLLECRAVMVEKQEPDTLLKLLSRVSSLEGRNSVSLLVSSHRSHCAVLPCHPLPLKS